VGDVGRSSPASTPPGAANWVDRGPEHRGRRAATSSYADGCHHDTVLYDDGRITCDDSGVVIRWYYPWGDKPIPYAAIRSVTRRPLTGIR